MNPFPCPQCQTALDPENDNPSCWRCQQCGTVVNLAPVKTNQIPSPTAPDQLAPVTPESVVPAQAKPSIAPGTDPGTGAFTVCCPGCGLQGRVSLKMHGKNIRCKRCSALFLAKNDALEPAQTSTAPSHVHETMKAEAISALDFTGPATNPVAPKAKRDRTQPSSSLLPLAIIGIAAVVLLVGGGSLAFIFLQSPNPDPTLAAKATQAEAPVLSLKQERKDAKADKVAPKQEDPASTTTVSKKQEEQKKPELPPQPIRELDATQANVRLLKSTVLILQLDGDGISCGTGTLVDHKNGLVLTNHHVVDRTARTIVCFPFYENGKIVTDYKRYRAALSESGALNDIAEYLRPGKVLQSDIAKDLALVKVDSVPNGVVALPLAAESVKVGEFVVSMGNPGVILGGDRPLWVLTTGTVRAVYGKQWLSPIGKHDATVVETQSPTNAGDSGGPLINRRGHLVAVTQGGARAIIQDTNTRVGVAITQGGTPVIVAREQQRIKEGETLRNYFIDVGEVHTFLERYYRSIGEEYVRKAPSESLLTTAVSIGALIKNLQHEDHQTRLTAVQSLGEIGAEARAAVPGLLQIANNDKDEAVQKMAVEALWRIGPPSDAEYSSLLIAIKEGKEHSCLYALDAVQKAGVNARTAVPALAELLGKQDAKASLRVSAAKALRGLGLSANGAIPVLIQGLKDSNIEIRSSCALALGRTGPADKTAIPQLLELLMDADAWSRAGAVFSLSQTDLDEGEAKAAVGGLAKALSDSGVVRKAACSTLQRMGPKAAGAGEALAKLLEDKEPTLKIAAIDALAAIGPGAKAAIPRLVVMLGEPDFQADAMRALGKMGEPAVFPLVRTLTDQRPAVRAAAVDVLGELGPAAKSAIPALELRQRADPRIEVQSKASQAIRRIRAQ